MIVKKDLLDQALDGQPLDPMAVLREPLVVHEATPIFRVLEQFQTAPVRLAIVIDEYGGLEGIVTQTDLLEAIAGDLPDVEGEEPDIVEREDGSLLIDGTTPAHEAFSRLGLRPPRGRLPHHRRLRARTARPPAGGRRAVRLRGLAVRDRRHGRAADRQAAGEPGGGLTRHRCADLDFLVNGRFGP